MGGSALSNKGRTMADTIQIDRNALEQFAKAKETLRKSKESLESSERLLEELRGQLPAEILALIDDESAPTRAVDSTATRKKKLSSDDKAALLAMTQKSLKGKKDGKKFGEIKKFLIEQLPDLEFSNNHLRDILKENKEIFRNEGEKINSVWFLA
jgi:hypothetical protein